MRKSNFSHPARRRHTVCRPATRTPRVPSRPNDQGTKEATLSDTRTQLGKCNSYSHLLQVHEKPNPKSEHLHATSRAYASQFLTACTPYSSRAFPQEHRVAALLDFHSLGISGSLCSSTDLVVPGALLASAWSLVSLASSGPLFPNEADSLL
jgi:hypothetical protein